MESVHRSKIDRWLLLIIVFAIAASLYASIELVRAGPPAARWTLLLTVGLGVVLPLWLLLDTRYLLRPDRLAIRCGPFRWQVPIAEIEAIVPTRNPLSSPALSLDRLRIDYGRGRSIMISPQHRQRFLEELDALRR
ncbi:MAG: PH domain-containing protein [Lautropia sp.]